MGLHRFGSIVREAEGFDDDGGLESEFTSLPNELPGLVWRDRGARLGLSSARVLVTLPGTGGVTGRSLSFIGRTTVASL